MARPGVVDVCDTAAAAERSATPTMVAAVAFDFMTFTSCFAPEINTACRCWYISEKTRPPMLRTAVSRTVRRRSDCAGQTTRQPSSRRANHGGDQRAEGPSVLITIL